MFWLLNRLRGNYSPDLTTTAARLLYWAFPIMMVMTLLAELDHLPKWVGIVSGGLAWGGMALGHSFAQGDSKAQYVDMGLVSVTRLMAILLPLCVANVFFLPPHLALWFVIIPHFFLCWGASALSYGSFFQTKSLTLFGTQLCKPGDSSWEELLVGACYDITFTLLFVGGVAHV